MANNYCEGSSFLDIPEDKLEKAQEIIDRVEKELEEDDECGYCGCQAELEKGGVWFHGDESINPEHVAEIARALVEELELDKPFYCSWAYTCSKPRIDEFGGGAFVIVRGKQTYWVDAMSHVMNQVEHGGLEDLEYE
jgi:hypothetical protein